MKTQFKSNFLIYGLLLLAACGLPSEADQESDSDSRGLKRPQTIFEGTWTWLGTDGSGIAGPYHSDSTTTGYSVRYVFGFSDLQTYRNEQKDEHFTYTFAVNDGKSKETELILTGDDKTVHSFFYDIKTENDLTYLFLRNTEPCCDNTFEKQFKLIMRPDLGKSK